MYKIFNKFLHNINLSAVGYMKSWDLALLVVAMVYPSETLSVG